jgi:hypothetical protein
MGSLAASEGARKRERWQRNRKQNQGSYWL